MHNAAAVALLVLAAGGCLDSPDRLLREGRAAEVLARVRPVRPVDYRRRALALRALGSTRQAAEELRIAVALDPGSVEGLRALGFVEAQLGSRGAALRAFERANLADPRDPVVRAALARLLIARARWRADPATRIAQTEAAHSDLERAVRLDPGTRPIAERARSELGRAGGSPAAQCPGPPPEADRPRVAPPRARCELAAPRRLVESLERTDPLIACRGVELALRLEAAGCSRAALALWEGLEREAPSDPRWPLHTGAAWLSLGEVERARLRFIDGAYLARDRGAALLTVARLHLEAKLPRLAGGYAVDALGFPLSLEQKLEAARILLAVGYRAPSGWSTSPTSAPRRPAR